MEPTNVILPYKEYNSTLLRYSDSDQLQANQYKSIIESKLDQAYYDREYPSVGAAALGPLNANVPVTNMKVNINVGDKNVNVYKKFWQYKQHSGSIFTDWNSAGISAIKEDLSIKNLPLYNKIHDSNLVLSNTNYVRNNLTNYGKEYLTTTNMLNAEAFLNGVSYESGNTSPYRSGQQTEIQQIIHGSFNNAEDGDLYSRQVKELRVDLPINYANTSISSWMYINPAFIIPNKNIKILHDALKFGIFDLDSIKLVGTSCLTSNFGVTPKGYPGPVDVINDDNNYPPVKNPDYYTRGELHYATEGSGENMYCSANTNYVVMPVNHAPSVKGLDTSFQVSTGNNSITIGVVMSPKLKNFINNDLHKLNRDLILMHLHQFPPLNLETNIRKIIETNYSHLFNKNNGISIHDEYSKLIDKFKYTWVYNKQRNLATKYQGNPEIETFINELNIFKFGGNNTNFLGQVGQVRFRNLGININDINIEGTGCFLLLPTMLSEDLFGVRKQIPSEYTSMNVNHADDNNNCITSNNYKQNATNCAFRDHAFKWQQQQDGPNFVPNMFKTPDNDYIVNSTNFYAGKNPYNTPNTF